MPDTGPQTKAEIRAFLQECVSLKPSHLKIDDVNWRALMLAVVSGENILITGPTGSGKTMVATIMAEIFRRPFFPFNMGGTQDPRSTLIGNTHYTPERGTFVAQALFVQAIQIPKAIILLDELSRAHPEAHNILMTVLDQRQRYLRVDEDPASPTIKVGAGVCIIATANVGSEYVGARTMDRALVDRFSIIDMQPLSKEDELELLAALYPELEKKALMDITEIAAHTRKQAHEATSPISTIISTRMSERVARKMDYGISLADAAMTEIYPFFPASGGELSERQYMKQFIQKYLSEPGTPTPSAPYTVGRLNPPGMKKPWV